MAEEQEIDLTWRPTEEQYSSPLTAEQWAELLQDPAYVESDAGRGLLCLRDYGEPATFQQLSIKYRGTMGRFRRWLSDAAQMAGERFGVAVPQQDEYGLDEWWPLLYQTRPAGKPGANMYEMRLRPEVLEGFDLVNEKERQARKAEDVRNLKRIEQIERARQQERERQAAAAPAQPADDVDLSDGQLGSADEATGRLAAPDPTQEVVSVEEAAPEQEASFHDADDGPVQPPSSEQLAGSMRLDALRAALLAERPAASPALQATLPFDVAAPVDYALRYAERLRSVFALMQEGEPSLSAAMVARELGDTSVARLQDILNGELIPEFAYLDNLQDRMFVNSAYLEAREGEEGALPAFCTLEDAVGAEAAVALLEQGSVEQAYLIREASGQKRSTVVVGLGALRFALLARTEVAEDALEGLTHEKCRVSASVFDALLGGKIWPGAVV